MKLNIGIIDDSLHDIAYITDKINTWGEKSGCEINVSSYISAEYILNENGSGIENADIVFVDVMMPEIRGIDLVPVLKERFKSAKLYVLTSTNSGYANDGYSVEAFDFLSKPVMQERLSAILDRAQKKIFSDNSGAITFEYGKILYKINFADIYFIYINGNYANVVAKNNETYMFRQTLKKLLQILPQSFIQVNRNTIVNVSLIETISVSEISFRDIDKTVTPSKNFMNDLVRVFKSCN